MAYEWFFFHFFGQNEEVWFIDVHVIDWKVRYCVWTVTVNCLK